MRGKSVRRRARVEVNERLAVSVSHTSVTRPIHFSLSTPMPASEIDNIFASKGKPQASSSTSTTPTVEKKKKKKDKKRKHADTAPVPSADDPPAKSKKARTAPVPETVVDTSSALLSAPAIVAPAKKSKTSGSLLKKAAAAKSSSGSKKNADADDDEGRFKDSRGTGPRKKTEEGFSIYKEDELGIQDEGGDTPQCPFDCQCCF
ncbi:DUF1764-domain-containing protein [Peniophora sp. CONT]|nr:DUF1764-domain-containing protein [Peniophora sp. CONT]